MKAPSQCGCGHHRLSHTYTAEGNSGSCKAGPHDARCTCAKFKEKK